MVERESFMWDVEELTSLLMPLSNYPMGLRGSMPIGDGCRGLL